MDEDTNMTEMETSADMIMPLPLTEEQIDNLTEENYTTEVSDVDFVGEQGNNMGRAIFPGNFFPENNRPNINRPNTNITIIPIIPGVTKFSYIRFLNANPFQTPVDIYINGRKVASYLNYRAFTEYMKAFPGYYRIVVFKAGTRRNPISVSQINIIANRIYTAAFIDTGINSEWQMITDNTRILNQNRAFVRFIQLSYTAPLMDVYIDNRLVLSDLDFQEVSRYLSLAPGSRNIKLKVATTNRTILEDPNMFLRAGNSYSVYIVGDSNNRMGLQVLIPLEGTSYLSF